MITLINGYPQGPDSLIVPNGSVTFQLNLDATVIAPPYGFVCASEVVDFQFNALGQIQPNGTNAAAQIYSNRELQPQLSPTLLGTYYLVCFYDQNGARLNKVPLWWQFPEAAGATVDISNMTAISTIGGNVIYYPTNFSGGGSVTSVAFVGDGIVLSATPSTPVISSGNVTATLLTQSANTVLAGPTTGAAATPTFRTLTAADISGLLTPGGSTSDIQVNHAGTFYGDGNFTYVSATQAVAVAGTLTITGGAFPNTIPLNVVSSANGPTNVVDAVAIFSVTGGTTPSYLVKSVNDDLIIRTDASAIPTHALINLTGTGTLFFQVPNVGTLLFNNGGLGYGGGDNQLILTMFETGTTPHGFYINASGLQTGHFFAVDDGSYTQLNQTAVSLVLTQVAVSGGSTTYTGTISRGGSNALVGFTIAFGGFTNGGNNVNAVITASSGTTLVVSTTTQVNETHAGTAIVNYNSPIHALVGDWWNGSASVQDVTELQDLIGPGTTPTSTLQISNSGAHAWGGVSILGALAATTLTATAATPTGTSGQVGFGTTAGFGNGSSGTAVTTTTKSSGTGPTTPQTVVNYLEIDIAGTKYWLPLVQ